MCIIGELGKLLLEEVPLEQTPPGYGRAPYQGYAKTESAVNEATKCVSPIRVYYAAAIIDAQLATVRFSAGTASPQAPVTSAQNSGAPHLPNPHQVAAAEEFGTLPHGVNGTLNGTKGKDRDYSLDTADPYGGLSNPYQAHQSSPYDEFGGTRGAANDRHVMFQGPTTDEAAPSPKVDYEYEQQKQLDAEERAWREGQPTTSVPTGLGAVIPPVQHEVQPTTTQVDENGLGVPWQPLNVKRERGSANSIALHDDGVPQLDTPDLGERIAAPGHSTRNHQTGYMENRANDVHGQSNDYMTSPTTIDLPPPPPIGSMYGGGGAATPPEREGFYTPLEGPTPEPFHPSTLPDQPSPPFDSVPPTPPAPPAPPAPPVPTTSLPPPPAPIPLPSPSLPSAAQTYNSAPGSGKISAAAFRRGAKNRGSTDPEDVANYASPTSQNQSPESANRAPRRLPLPPPGVPSGSGEARPETPIEAGFELPDSPGTEGKKRLRDSAYDEARTDEFSPPPSYSHGESLR